MGELKAERHGREHGGMLEKEYVQGCCGGAPSATMDDTE